MSWFQISPLQNDAGLHRSKNECTESSAPHPGINDAHGLAGFTAQTNSFRRGGRKATMASGQSSGFSFRGIGMRAFALTVVVAIGIGLGSAGTCRQRRRLRSADRRHSAVVRQEPLRRHQGAGGSAFLRRSCTQCRRRQTQRGHRRTPEPNSEPPPRDRGKCRMDQGPQFQLRHSWPPTAQDREDIKPVRDCLLKETEERIDILIDSNFDCLAVNTTAGLLICSDPTLALAKAELNELVMALIARLKEDEARDAFVGIRAVDPGTRPQMRPRGQGQRSARGAFPLGRLPVRLFHREDRRGHCGQGRSEEDFRQAADIAGAERRCGRPVRRANPCGGCMRRIFLPSIVSFKSTASRPTKAPR